MTTAQAGSRVTVEYVGTLTTGEVFDSTTDRGPVSFTLGAGEVLPAFEEALAGKSVGEEISLSLNPENGYGDRDEGAVQVVPQEAFDPEMDIQVGMYIVGENDGNQFPARVVAVASNGITIDMNHPLAGQDLNFEITLTDVSSDEDVEVEASAGEEE